MAGMPNMARIDLKSTLGLLEKELHAHAVREGLHLSALHGLALAEAYRQAKDPDWGRAQLPSGPSSEPGVALARALGMLALHEGMAPVLAEVHEVRRVAVDAEAALSSVLQGLGNLRRLGQSQCPLFDAKASAGAALQALATARLLMGPSLTDLPEDGRAGELLLNATRELSQAFRPAQIAELIDDCGGGTSTQRLDRVRRRIRDELPKFPPGYSEGFAVSHRET
ncbi:MAG: hypothetical protein K0R38_6249 [Polyangiaceae bacterium]|jgi:hypothetical protein|nr:hypothetical protein [Polyangiaceae bacterium]